MTYDFMIFGGGLSSKVLAISLSQNNYKVLLIQDKSSNSEKNNLVTFISDGSIHYLSKIMDIGSFIEKNEPINEIYCEHLIKKLKTKLIFNDQNNKALGKIVSNAKLDKFLDREISNRSSFITLFGNQKRVPTANSSCIEFTDDNHKKYFAKLLFYSSTKKNNDITEEAINDFEIALSIDVNVDRLKKNVAYQIFTQDGPLALLPISHNEASIVWSLKRTSNYLNLNHEDLENTLNDFFKDHVSKLNIVKINKFNLSFSYAKKLHYGKCVLIGNIAHNIHPIAGQGLNLTIKDIASITSCLNKYRSTGLDFASQQVLEDFSNNRKFDNFIFSFGTLALENIFSSKNRLVRSLTGKSLYVVNRSQKIKNFFINKARAKNKF